MTAYRAQPDPPGGARPDYGRGVLLLLVLTLGLTGFSDRILSSVVGEQIRVERTTLAETIRDPDKLERVLATRKAELESFYGLDIPWQRRLPASIFRVMRLDLGEARSLRSFSGSNRIADIVLERLPNTILLMTTSTVIVALTGLAGGLNVATRPGSWIDRLVSGLAPSPTQSPPGGLAFS